MGTDRDFGYDVDTVSRCANFNTKADALKSRKKVDGYKTAFGAVTVTRHVLDWYVEKDRAADWVDTNDE